MSDRVSDSASGSAPIRKLSVADLQGAAVAFARGLVPIYSPGDAIVFAEPSTSSRAILAQHAAEVGMQEVLDLPDELLLVRTDYHAISSSQRQRWELDMRGWLYLHFRLDGRSEEETPNGLCGSYDGGWFLLSASQRRPCARRLLGAAWRSVGILCRPAFATGNLQTLSRNLPRELQRMRDGDPDAEFWCTGRLTSDMRAAVTALLQPRVHGDIRRAYLHAKVIELVCLGLEEVRRTQSPPRDLVRLTAHDVNCLEEARRILMNCASAPSLERLAKHVGINRCKLALGFKQLFGMTIGQYHRERRLELARGMLENDTIAIGRIAAAAGYADAGSFSKAFREHFGVLPSELRLTSKYSDSGFQKE